MIDIISKDITEEKEFILQGTKFIQKEYNEKSGRWLYERYYINSPTLGNKLMGYEIVKPKRKKNSNGTIVNIYPSTSQFGTIAWFLPPNTPREKIDKYLNGELPLK